MMDHLKDITGVWINRTYFPIGKAEEQYGAVIYSAHFAERNAVAFERKPAWLDKEIGR